MNDGKDMNGARDRKIIDHQDEPISGAFLRQERRSWLGWSLQKRAVMSPIVQMLWGERRGHGTFGAVQRLPKELPHVATTF